MDPVTTAALGIGTSVAQGATNLIFGGAAQKQQLAGRKESLRQDYDYWLKTNYSAQKDQLNKAGLNPGLMYGMGSGGGGQSAGGDMPQAASSGGMDIAQNAQLSLMKAQEEKLKADARKANIDADKTEGVDTAAGWQGIEESKANIKSMAVKNALTEIQTEIGKLDKQFFDDTYANKVGIVQDEKSILGQKLRSISAMADIDEVTKENVIKGVQLDLGIKLMVIAAAKQGIDESKARVNLMSTQGKQMLSSIYQKWAEIEDNRLSQGIQKSKLDLEKEMFEFEKFTGIPKSVINGVIGGSIIKGVINPGRTVVEGFKGGK